MPHPVARHEDAPEVRVPAEADAHHVVNFPLVPIGRGPHLGHRIDGRGLVIRQPRLQGDAGVVLVAVEVAATTSASITFSVIGLLHFEKSAEVIFA